MARDLPRYGVRPERVRERESVLDWLDHADAVVLGFFVGASDIDNAALCRAIRVRSDIPIVALVRRADVGERILGLRVGADDYLCRPYSAGTLIARTEVIRRFRTRQFQPAEVLRIDDVSIDLRARAITVGGERLHLTRKEFEILEVLAGEGGGVCARDTLITQIWGGYWVGAHENLNVHIRSLRMKIGRPHLIETVRGIGYRLAVPSLAAYSAGAGRRD